MNRTLKDHARTLRDMATWLRATEREGWRAEAAFVIAMFLETLAAYPEPPKPVLDWSKPLKLVAGGDVKAELIRTDSQKDYPRRVRLSRGTWSMESDYTEEGNYWKSFPDHPWNLENDSPPAQS